MTTEEAANFHRLQDSFENREAIYIEKGALRVRVTNIRECEQSVLAQVEEIPTAGFEDTLFHRYRLHQVGPIHWGISGGYLTDFSDNTWDAGYGGWSLFFAPRIVQGVVDLASRWPLDLHYIARYNEVLRFLMDNDAYEPGVRVFADE